MGDALDLFVRLLSFVSRLVSNTESSAGVENTSLGIVQEKRLSDSIQNYKAAIKEVNLQDEEEHLSETKIDFKPTNP